MADEKQKDVVQEQQENTEPKQQEASSAEKAQGAESAQGKVSELQAVIKGLNRVISKKDEEIAALKAKVEELESKLADVSAKASQLDEVAKKAEEYEQTLRQREREIKRKNLVLSKFPELAKLEANGLLPDAGDDEELEQKLASMHKTVLELAKSTAAQALQGVSHDVSGGTSDENIPQSEEELIEAAMQAAVKGDTKTYERYMELLSKRG